MIRAFFFGLILTCLAATGCAATPGITPTQGAAGSGAARAVDPNQPVDGANVAPVIETVPDISRDQAITQLADMAFLSFGDASCVIDAIHDVVGVYDFTSAVATEQADQAELMRACTEDEVPTPQPVDADQDSASQDTVEDPASEDPASEDPASESEASAETEDDAPEVAIDSEADTEDEQLPPVQPPAFAPGGITTGTVELAGAALDYAVVTPSGFAPGSSAPVFIALPDSGDNLAVTSELTASFFLDGAVARGWVVVSPVLSGSDAAKASTINELANWIGTWVTVQGKPHLGGFGGGGSSAFAMAAQNPSAFQSLMIYPGLAPSPLEPAAQQLAQLPVRMWVVSSETNRWIGSLREADEAIRSAGGNVTLYALTVEEAVKLGTDDAFGNLIFNELQNLR